MAVVKFIDEKSEVLARYLNLFLMRKLTYTQLNHFLWDTLQEWENLDIYDERTDSCKEEVFWHLLFELKNWTSQQIFSNRTLRQQLYTSALFLQGQGAKPYGCVGIRPIPEYLDQDTIYKI